MTSYLPINGTWGMDDSWVINDSDPFALFMADNWFTPIRKDDGTPWTWNGKLNGFLWFGQDDWYATSNDLEALLKPICYSKRNLLAFSHGGQPALILAARGFPIRSLTTIGTPRRHDIDAEAAAKSIMIWQHIHDEKLDVMASLRRTLGQLGDGAISLERRFLIPGVRNVGLPDISHGKMLHDPSCFHFWNDLGILDLIRGSDAGGS